MDRKWTILFAAIVVAIGLNAAYLAAFDSPTILYYANVVAHVGLGVALVVGLGVAALRRLAHRAPGDAPGWPHRVLFVPASIAMVGTGVWLVKVGTASPYGGWLRLHEIATLTFLVAFALLARRRAPGSLPARAALGTLLVAVLLPLVVRAYGWFLPEHPATITNPPLPPLSPFAEGAGQDSPFFTSSNRTVGDRLVPSDFFLESKSCGNKGCHPDIVAQWEASAHHFSSFNNQWYRKSVEYMQDVVGTKPSKWCGGCHDMAILLTGRMDTPIREQIHTPEAQAGIGCLVCHSIVQVSDTMGQGGFTLEYPETHRLVASRNPVVRKLHDFMVRLDPAPHKTTMLKPFHRQSTPEFCSACHKVHLDVPINHYRWFRGFNDYDAWQMSGVSGQGARAFYYPPDGPKKCGSCHMPLVPSRDAGNVGGYVHSHRFPGANTALPVANRDLQQFEIVKQFLRDGILSLDIFAVSEDATEPPGEPGAPADAPPRAQSMFPGEDGLEGGARRGGAALREVIAPIERAEAAVRPGSTVRVDVVARTRKVGHFFPGGTVDAFDVWLELKARDADGRVLYWSGWVADDGQGPVDPGAHFYRSVLVDEHGNRIDKRNAWAARAVAYVRLIPPGAADTAHFRLDVPPDVRGPIRLSSRMNYRKFSWFYTNFSFAGERDPAQRAFALGPGYDDGRWVFTADTSDVSGQIKGIPDLPTIVVAEDHKLLQVGGRRVAPEDRERWNDYGVGLLLQRDFENADAAFRKVTELDPRYADGWVNRARVAIEEGSHVRALEHLERALRIDPDLPKARYFRGLALKSFGRYDEALDDLRRAASVFPRDRVVLNAIGRILFLHRSYAEAVEAFRRTLAVDPEDLTAHYNLMLCYRGLGNEAMASTHETLYARFKADESAQSLTGAFRRLHPDDNRERQAIHVHESTWTAANRAAASRMNVPGPWTRASGR
jgi:tetratricopeptide (TPR) repeat protein